MRHETTAAFPQISALTQAQRDAAYSAARTRIAGPQPQLADFAPQQYARYPAWVTGWVVVLCVIFLVAAFVPSAQRLHAVALQTNQAISGIGGHEASYRAAAAATVLMAEAGQIVFSLAAATISAQRLRFLRIPLPGALTIASWICLAIALAGNAAAVGQPQSNAALATQVITLLETYAPPFLVLINANVLKAQMLNAIEGRHTAQSQYQRALAEWRTALAGAERHERWLIELANALRAALEAHNKRSPRVLRELTIEDWYALIARERSAAEWYAAEARRLMQPAAQSSAPHTVERAQPTASTSADHPQLAAHPVAALKAAAPAPLSGRTAGKRTFETDGAVSANTDGTFTATCPYCAAQFIKTTHAGATNALGTHIGRYCAARRTQRTTE